MNGWERAKQMAERCGGGEYVALKNDGDFVIGVFCGEPHGRLLHWVDNASHECTNDDNGEGDCPHCAKGIRCSMKASMNFYVLAERKMKKFEGSQGWFDGLLAIMDKYKDLGDHAIEVKRHGKAGDTKTKYTFLYDHPLKEDEKKRVAAAPLHNLAGDSEEKDEPLPPKVFDELKARLKKLPKAAGFEFLGKFGAERLSDLKASDEKRAREVLDALEKPATAKDEQTDEMDPFS